MRLKIIHEDPHFWAVDKPAGQNVIPGRGPRKGLCLRDELAQGTGGKAWVVHRIDRDTSGLVLFAKTAEAHRRLNALFESRGVKKEYLTLLQGALAGESGVIDKPLREFGSGRAGVSAGGKPSVTRFEVLERRPAATLARAEPLTGRRHQIRVHFWSLGHPVMGDALYGRPRPVGGFPRLMLHAAAISFAHPFERGTIRLRSAPPDDFLEGLRIVGASEKVYFRDS